MRGYAFAVCFLSTLFTPLLATKSSSLPSNKRSSPITYPIHRRASSYKSIPDDKSVADDDVDAQLEWLQRIRQRDIARGQRLRDNADGAGSLRKGRRGSWETAALSSWAGDSFYFTTIKMGTPPQSIDVDLDTGSGDLWVASKTCTTCNTSTVEPYYDGSSSTFDSTTSSTFVGSNDLVTVSYGDGSAIRGSVSTDTVSLGSYTSPTQTFLLVTAQNADFDIAGLMGLGFPRLSQSGGTPWWLAVLSQFDQPEMSFYFAQWSSRTDDVVVPGGQFTMGGRNASLYDGEVQFVPLISQSYWSVRLQSIRVNEGTTLALSSAYDIAIVDTGTTLIQGPGEVVDAFYKAVPGAIQGATVSPQLAGYWVIPCNTTINAKFTFSNDVSVTMPATLLGYQSAGRSLPNYCAGAIIGSSTSPYEQPPSSSSAPAWILGDAFLRSTYTVFRNGPLPSSTNGTITTGSNGSQAGVGFAPLKGVNYATNGLAMLGLDGDGVDGRIGNAGVIVSGGANGATISGADGTTQTATSTHTRSSASGSVSASGGGGGVPNGSRRRGLGWSGLVVLLVVVFVL